VSESRYPYAAADLDEVRKHVRKLFDAHHSHSTLVRITGIPHETLMHILYRNKSITKRNRDIILGIKIQSPWDTPGLVLTDGDRVPAIGTARRIWALVRMGYTITQIAKGSGRSAVHLREISLDPNGFVLLRTAKSVQKFYRTAKTVIPQGRKSEDARRRAERNGWPGIGAWDDIDRDPGPDPAGNRVVVVDFIRDRPGLTTSDLQRTIRAELGVQRVEVERMIKEALRSGEIVRVRDKRTVRVYINEKEKRSA
jgi:hypothetical protein